MQKDDQHEPRDGDLSIRDIRQHWGDTSRFSLDSFLDSYRFELEKSDCWPRSHFLNVLMLAIELSAKAGHLKSSGDVVDQLFCKFPKISSDERIQLGACEEKWLKSSQTIVVSGCESTNSSSQGSELQVPEIQGFCNVVRVGQGALGIVYRASQLGTNRTVAIKCIRPEYELDDRARQLFVRESSIVSRLHHPRIIECLGFGFCGLRPYLVMEFFPSEDLEQLVWKHSPERRVRLAVKIVLKMLEALIYAHSQGVVHRDIKPQNILARVVNGRLQLKVSDFGLAKMFETSGHSGITKTGELCGTLAYMPPEQLKNSRDVKPDVDVYAAVVCLYRLLTREYPHGEGMPSELYHRQLNEDARPPQNFNSDIPNNLAEMLMEGLSRRRNSRFRTALDLSLRLKGLKLLDP